MAENLDVKGSESEVTRNSFPGAEFLAGLGRLIDKVRNIILPRWKRGQVSTPDTDEQQPPAPLEMNEIGGNEEVDESLMTQPTRLPASHLPLGTQLKFFLRRPNFAEYKWEDGERVEIDTELREKLIKAGQRSTSLITLQTAIGSYLDGHPQEEIIQARINAIISNNSGPINTPEL